MRGKIVIAAVLLCSLYVLSYIWLRETHKEVWERDRQVYVIFPENKVLYYIYRPVSYLDGKLTGINFHIGRHR